jgi:hypothetical protein
VEHQNWLESLLRSLNVELPHRENLEEYIDMIVPAVRKWGEDLSETKYYSSSGGKPWLEVRDEADFHNTILHFFNPEGEYLRATDGNVLRGKWRVLEGTNKMIIDLSGDKGGGISELFELAYMDAEFFILKKHGNQLGRRKYLTMGFEPYTSGLEWRDYAEALFNTYRSKARTYRYALAFAVFVAILILLFSIF